MQNWNQYMNLFLESVTHDTICECCKDVPSELGNIELDKKNSFKGIVYFGWNMRFKQDLKVSKKGNYGRDEIQIIFNMNQNIEWQIEESGQLIQMKKGEVCVYRNFDHTTFMTYQSEQNFLFKSVQIPTELFCNLLIQYFPTEQVQRVKKQFLKQVTKTAITQDMYHILNEIEHASKFKEFEGLYLEGKMIELIALVLHTIFYNETRCVRSSLILSEIENLHLEQIRECIDNQPAWEYPAEQLALEAGMSVSKFNKAFRQRFGESLHAYVINKRLEYAASLLKERKYNISEVASLSGYSNLSHFSDAFRKKYGVLPKKYTIMIRDESEKC